MARFRASRVTLSGVVAVALLGAVAPTLWAVAAPRVSSPPTGAVSGAVAGSPVAAAQGIQPPALSDAELMGLAALAGAGIEVRHAMKVPGPDPRIALFLPPAATPSGSPAASGPGDLAGRVAPGRASSGIVSAWHSGASGDAVVNGTFGPWRGEPVQIMGTWNDTTAESQRDIGSLRTYSGWNGDIDVAIGALASGESWARAATGAYADRWTQAVRNIKAQRSGRSGTVYVRFAHEMTGDWFTWKVNPGNVSAFKTAWRLFHGILVREYPQAKLVFSPNDGNHSGVPLDRIWPGDDVVDVVGPDSYDGWPNKTTQALWDGWINSTGDGPNGLGAWRQFAAAHHKPFALPEWGLRNLDNPFFITKMHEFLASCAPRPGDTDLSGKCIYDIYFNISNGGNSGFMIYGGPNPNAARTYRTLAWGVR